ncbi:PH domain-containing protein [soil metagenome]
MFETPQRLHPAAIIIKLGTYFVEIFKQFAIPFAAVIFTSLKDSHGRAPLYIALAFAAIGAISVLRAVLHFLSTNYVIRDGSLIINNGFIWRKHRTIPLNRIQNVNIERTIWHKLLGAAAVKIETAAGKKTEGDLEALSLPNAERLEKLLLQSREQDDQADPVAPPKPLYQLNLRQVLLTGALSNRAVYIIASTVAVLQSEGVRQGAEPVAKWASHLDPMMQFAYAVGGFLTLIVVGWLLSIVMSATRYYNFQIQKHEKGFLITNGLITQFRSVLPVGRIQDLRVVQPLLYQAFGYTELYADTAGSYNKHDTAAANKVCPLIPEGGVDHFGQMLLPEFSFERLDWQRLSHRAIMLYTFSWIRAAVIFLCIPLGYWLHWNAFWALIPIAILATIFGLVHYQVSGYAFTEDLVASRHGVLRREAIILPFDRIQHFSTHSSFLQRLFGVASVSAVSASSMSHALGIGNVDQHAADEIRRRIETSVQSHLGKRRAGL